MDPELHAWNQGFAWSDHRGPFRLISAEQARAYDELGFFVAEGVFDRAEIARLQELIDPAEQRRARWIDRQYGGIHLTTDTRSITFTRHLASHEPALRKFVRGPFFRDICMDLLGPDVRLYGDQAVYKKPEKPRPFPWHQDNGYMYVEPQTYLTCWIPLVDATEENGCVRAAPGLHRRGTLRHWDTEYGLKCLRGDPPNQVPVPVRAGSVLVFSSLTPHITGPNVSDHVRKAYIVQFAVEGTVAVRGDGARASASVQLQDDGERQFRVVDGGRGVGGRMLGLLRR